MGAPTGNVTLVFTDIEGSTRLWERYGDAFKASLDAHNQIIRKALAAHSGYEVKTEGDAFF
ncbi:MAG TPA: adenylate/guanylate cyclase domain-containing protein, partial [Planctomycetota bacterium]|nr:adenylate/guanylate cyclase domain-containing protein [Planctomycetota bacterium]